MSKIHIVESDNSNSYKVVIHFATPTGNNSVGYSWKACGLASGISGTTELSIGTDPGNITQTEYDNIIAGDTIEIIRLIQPGMNPTNDEVKTLVDIQITNWNADTSKVLKYYGHKIEA